MFGDGEVLEELRLIRDERERGLGGHRLLHDVEARDAHRARARSDDACDAAECRRLAGTIRPDQTQHFPRRYLERQLANRGQVAIHLRE